MRLGGEGSFSSSRELAHDGGVASGPLPREGSSRLDAILEEFESRWNQGERPKAEEYLCEPLSDADAVALIFHEYCLAGSSGEPVEAGPFLARFPTHRHRLEQLIALREVIDIEGFDPSAGEPGENWPEPGDSIGQYLLKRVLGEGAFARVYLAEQTDLAHRLVVVKLERRSSHEPYLLARARHPHIIDVLNRASTADGRFHLVCMPYLGGATLATLLEAMRARGWKHRPRAGRAWLKILDDADAGEWTGEVRSSPFRAQLARLSYARAMAWLAARLAEGLGAAHQRGVVHGDIKPSNILVALDGRPLLLDFNLGVGWEDSPRAEGGGTLAYMSPERLRAFVRVAGTAEESAGAVRARLESSDLYSLGLLLVELLTWEPPPCSAEARPAARSVARVLAEQRSDPRTVSRLISHRAIPAGLRPVLACCLAARPEARYQSAGQLVEDLDRWIDHLPPRHARKPKILTCAGLWMLRHRNLLSWAACLLGACVLAGAIAQWWLHDRHRGHAIEKLEALWSGREPGVFRFERVGSWGGDDAAEVGEIARRVLDQYDALGTGDWRSRDDVATLPADARLDLELWLLEHTWKYARVLEERSSESERRRALALVERDRVWAELAPMVKERRRLRSLLGLGGVENPGVAADRSAVLDAYLEGISLEPRHARQARAAFRRAAALFPGSFWANYRVAACACRLGDYDEAAERLSRCLARLPANPALLTQFAGCLLQSGDDEAAERACDRALAISPDFRDAYATRALVHAVRGQRTGLSRDLEHYGWLMGRMQAVRRWNLSVFLAYSMGGSDLARSASAGGDEPRPNGSSSEVAAFHAWRGCMREWEGRRREAIEEYSEALRANPEHLWALYRRGRLQEALDVDRALDDYRTLVRHERVEELFSQQPVSLRVYVPLINAELRERIRGRDDLTRTRAREQAVSLSQEALVHARGTGRERFIFEMAYLAARVLVTTSEDPRHDSLEVARLLREACRLDSLRLRRSLIWDAWFTWTPPLPSWAPDWDPARSTRWLGLREFDVEE